MPQFNTWYNSGRDKMIRIDDLKGGIITDGNMRNDEVSYLVISVPNGKRYILLGDNTKMPCKEVV